MMSSRAKAGLRAAAWHMSASVVVALAMALIVFGVWYPYPHRAMAGGTELFWLVMSVDVVCGPLLTAVVFNPVKPRRELVMDLGLIVVVQLAALVYGMHAVTTMRPVALVFEADRFVSVAAASIPERELEMAPAQYAKLSWTGPILLGTRKPKDADEQLESIDLALQGLEVSMRPSWWQPYEESLADVRAKMKPVESLRSSLSATQQAVLDEAINQLAVDRTTLHYLPLVSSLVTNWIVLLNAEGTIVGYAAVDGF